MNKTLSSIPKMLNDTKNLSEVARVLRVSRVTVSKYRADHDCKHHIVVDGVLMSKTTSKQKKAGE